jgi:hypothetical protein
MDITFQRKLTLLKSKWRNARYKIKTKEGSKPKSAGQLSLLL